MDDDEKKRGKRYLQIAESLFRIGEAKRKEWVDVARMVLPDLIPPSLLNDKGKVDYDRCCVLAKDYALQLANAHTNYITPFDSSWFRFTPKDPNASQEDLDWHAQATDVIKEYLSRSNFYTENAPTTISRVFSGNGAIFSDYDEKEDELYFLHVPAGTYAFSEDTKHRLNTFVRCFNFTAAQLQEEFGEDKLPTRVKNALNDDNRRYATQFKVYHLVMPRADYVRGAHFVAAHDMPFASLYVLEEGAVLLSEGGFMEMPYMVTRFLRYGNQVYGTSPLLSAADVIRDLITLDDALVTTAQRCALPSVIVPPDMVDMVDFRAGGQTVVPLQYINSQVPREFAPPTNMPTVISLYESLENRLKKSLYIDMLQVVTNTGLESGSGRRTATEINAIEAEHVMTFSQSFTQHVSDMRPLLNRVFSLLFRAGKLPDNPPRSVVSTEKTERGDEEVLHLPLLAYNGRMAQAFERFQMNGSEQALTKLVQFSNAMQTPEPLANIDMVKYGRYVLTMNGMPSFLMKPSHVVEQELAELQQRQAQEASEQQALAASQARLNAAQAYSSVADL